MTEAAQLEKSNRVAVVTGGASGLGKGCADYFSQHGIRVVAVDLHAVDSSKSGGLIEGFVADVSSEKDILALSEHVRQTYGRLDYLVNCAGIAHINPTFDFTSNKAHDLALFSKILQVNTVGTFNVIRLLVPIMAKNQPDADGQRGVVINLSSVLGTDGVAGSAAYSASKGAVIGMTLPLAREFGPIGVRVVAVQPGFCDTPLIHHIPGHAALFQAVKVFPQRMIQPLEFGRFVQSIIDNPMLNGEVIRFDGGIRVPAF